MSLLEQIKSHVADDAVSGLVIEVEYHPLNGPASPVAPPTYASESQTDKTPRHAFTEEAFVPQATDDGWHTDIQRGSDTTPRLASRVVLNSYAAQSGRAETATWRQKKRLGVQLPAITVADNPAVDTEDNPQVTDASQDAFSTWELAHRQNDAWIKFATADGKKLVWQQDIVDIAGKADPEQVKSLIATASAERADLLYRYFPNSAIYGFWVSSGVAVRHRLARAFSSEIVGFGAHSVASGATKLDPTGGAVNTTSVTVNSDSSLTVEGNAKGKQKNRPSQVGFGQIPAHPTTHAFVCELILEQSSLSLQVLRSLRYPDREQALAATTVLTLLSLAGHALATEDGFLRSGCALVPIAERWGWRRRGERSPESLPIADVDEIAQALRAAIAEAEQAGLSFAAPIKLAFSEPELEIIRQRVKSDADTLTSDE
jgi:CRISPR-associated protein Csb1